MSSEEEAERLYNEERLDKKMKASLQNINNLGGKNPEAKITIRERSAVIDYYNRYNVAPPGYTIKKTNRTDKKGNTTYIVKKLGTVKPKAVKPKAEKPKAVMVDASTQNNINDNVNTIINNVINNMNELKSLLNIPASQEFKRSSNTGNIKRSDVVKPVVEEVKEAVKEVVKEVVVEEVKEVVEEVKEDKPVMNVNRNMKLGDFMNQSDHIRHMEKNKAYEKYNDDRYIIELKVNRTKILGQEFNGIQEQYKRLKNKIERTKDKIPDKAITAYDKYKMEQRRNKIKTLTTEQEKLSKRVKQLNNRCVEPEYFKYTFDLEKTLFMDFLDSIDKQASITYNMLTTELEKTTNYWDTVSLKELQKHWNSINK